MRVLQQVGDQDLRDVEPSRYLVLPEPNGLQGYHVPVHFRQARDHIPEECGTLWVLSAGIRHVELVSLARVTGLPFIAPPEFVEADGQGLHALALPVGPRYPRLIAEVVPHRKFSVRPRPCDPPRLASRVPGLVPANGTLGRHAPQVVKLVAECPSRRTMRVLRGDL